MRRPAVGVAALLAISACARPDPELARCVREYDDALVKAFATSDPSVMAAVAARKEAERVRILVDLKTNAYLVLESAIERLEVVSAKADGDAGTVETRERWRYHDRHRVLANVPPGPELVSDMVMRYALVREGGRWKVASVKTLSREYLRSSGKGGPGGAPAPAK